MKKNIRNSLSGTSGEKVKRCSSWSGTSRRNKKRDQLKNERDHCEIHPPEKESERAIEQNERRGEGGDPNKKKARVQIFFQPNIKVTISNGIWEVYDIIPRHSRLWGVPYLDGAASVSFLRGSGAAWKGVKRRGRFAIWKKNCRSTGDVLE